MTLPGLAAIRPTGLPGPESPTLGLGHLQFEALITTARQSTTPNDSALITALGLHGLRIFEACGANIDDIAEEHGHRYAATRRVKHLAATPESGCHRARKNLDRHPNYILATYMASGT
ncbi:hypothetical protein ABGB07_41290 [Micromonosporaceae bacterium B7E4]